MTSSGETNKKSCQSPLDQSIGQTVSLTFPAREKM